MKRTVLTRRTLLVGAAAGLAVTGLVGWQANEAVAEETVAHATLEKYLGPIAIADSDLAKFVAAFKAEQPWVMPGYKLALANAAAFSVGLEDRLRGVLPADDAAELERFERILIADFHSMTSFPWRAAPAAPVVFIGVGPCRNPFAQFA